MKVAAIVFVIVAILASMGVFVLQKSVRAKPASLAGFAIAPKQGLAVSNVSMNPEKDSASSSTISKWRVRIREDGPQKAYQNFADLVKGLNPAEQHVQSHLFGAALYREKGDAGFPICGNLFSFGCAHALIASAMQEEGVGAIGGFASACKKTSWPQMCYHGIGHGLIRATGYTERAVQEAMRLCANSVGDVSTAGCLGGVIMEYDGQSMIASIDGEREQTEANTYSPCTAAPAEAKSACYFWIVSWWYDHLYLKGVYMSEAFTRIGTLCHDIPEQEYLPQCLAGEGAMAAAAGDYSAPESIALCDASSELPEERLYCKAYAGNILLETSDGEKGITQICSSVGEAYESRCTYLAHKGVSVFD